MRIDFPRSTVVVLAVAIAALGCGKATVAWQDLEFADDGFKASFPGVPHRSEITVNTAVGHLVVTQYMVQFDELAFSVAVSEMPEDRVAVVGETGVLDGARDGAVANIQGTLLSEQILEVNGFPGRALKVSVAGGAGTVKTRILLVRHRLIQALVASSVEDSYRSEISIFLESVFPI